MELGFTPFPKIARLSRDCTISEKIDGTNASIFIGGADIPDQEIFLVGSRNRWITPEDDNYGFAKWAHKNKDELMKLGPGHHFGEWWGNGIQHGYGMKEKRFYLFNTEKWAGVETRPACCGVVPVLYEGLFDGAEIAKVLGNLREHGSVVAPGCMKPEGIMIWHHAARIYFKKTILKDESPKGA